ncbi:hypothetical protein JTB14_021423 [Gonioctena quinquepunctata]|nr:hypothetical protein JTB14_021423 [Gonioctena quinquepunctata]
MEVLPQVEELQVIFLYEKYIQRGTSNYGGFSQRKKVTTPPQTTNTTTLTSTSTIGGNVPISTTAPTSLRMPALYSLGMEASTLDNFSGKDAERYFEKLELRSKLDGWAEDETVKLLKFKLIGGAYNY